MGMGHLPILRFGESYTSLDTAEIFDVRTGESRATLSMANPALVRRDLRRGPFNQCLHSFSTAQLLTLCQEAGHHFMEGALPLADGELVDREGFIALLSSTTGLPKNHCERGMEKIHHVLTQMESVLAGLTGGLSPEEIDNTWTPAVECLAAIMPSNAPGVHTLWLPAIPLKTPVALKPGGTDPWTPFRIIQAFLAAGAPKEAFAFYPTTHEGAQALLLTAERGLIFGDATTVAPWVDHPGVEVHGPGRSKIVLGPDEAERWESHLEVIVESVVGGGGRSCINASSIVTTAHADALAATLAQRFSMLDAKGLDDPEAILAGFNTQSTVDALDGKLDELLATGGAEDITARYREGGRKAHVDGMHFLLPTVIRCDKPDHPLAQTEFPFPFVAVIEVPSETLVPAIEDTLVCTLISEDLELCEAMADSGEIERLNLGPIPTNKLHWDQPLEGNLFTLLSQEGAHAEEASS